MTIIEQTTEERNNEIRELFEAIKPLLDDGCPFTRALVEVGRIPYTGSFTGSRGWGKDLVEYAKTQGYTMRRIR